MRLISLDYLRASLAHRAKTTSARRLRDQPVTNLGCDCRGLRRDGRHDAVALERKSRRRAGLAAGKAWRRILMAMTAKCEAARGQESQHAP